jgi:hypothetical protein
VKEVEQHVFLQVGKDPGHAAKIRGLAGCAGRRGIRGSISMVRFRFHAARVHADIQRRACGVIGDRRRFRLSRVNAAAGWAPSPEEGMGGEDRPLNDRHAR